MEEKKVKLKGLVKLIGLKGSIEKLNAVFVDEDKAIMPTNYYNQLLDTQVNWLKLKEWLEKEVEKSLFVHSVNPIKKKMVVNKILAKMEELENKNDK